MAGLLYYVPGTATINKVKIVELGLGYAVEDGGPDYAGMSPGPDKASGVVFSLPGASGTQAQPSQAGDYTFEQMPGMDVWCGFNPTSPPAPEDLARKEQIGGHDVRLADGNVWHVPVARAVNGATSLPRRLKWDGTDWKPGDVLPQYRDLFAGACAVWDALVEQDAGEITFNDECGLAVTALAINYRLGPAEVSLLGLFDTESEGEVAKALIDWPTLEEYLKKKRDHDETSSPSGEQD